MGIFYTISIVLKCEMAVVIFNKHWWLVVIWVVVLIICGFGFGSWRSGVNWTCVVVGIEQLVAGFCRLLLVLLDLTLLE